METYKPVIRWWSFVNPRLLAHFSESLVVHSDRFIFKKGIFDMVRISDARMSGTAYGTVILHTSPEAAIGGPLAVVRDGDMIEVDVEAHGFILTYPKPNWRHGSPLGAPR